jgi:hypothetical protein
MNTQQRPPLTDSPWLYVLVFSLMALLALVVIGPKYGRRQSRDERKFQSRQRLEEQSVAGNNSTDPPRNDSSARQRRFSTPGDTLVPLWPLAVVLLAITLFAMYMLVRGRASTGTARGSLPNEISTP